MKLKKWCNKILNANSTDPSDLTSVVIKLYANGSGNIALKKSGTTETKSISNFRMRKDDELITFKKALEEVSK